MASLTTEKLKEMEAEMNRFEQEILTPGMGPKGGPPRMIIGSNTFSKVQARLSGDPDGRPTPADGRPTPADADPSIPLSVLSAPPPPPPRPSSRPSSDNESSSSSSNLFLPPPPPPPLPNLTPPSFVPPQLRQRAPGPPLNRPPLPNRPPMAPGSYGHPIMRGPMPGPPMRHPMGGPPMGGPGPYGYHGPLMRPPHGPPVSIEKPKVVYSAPPVRKVPKTDTQSDTSRDSGSAEIGVASFGMEGIDGAHIEQEDAGMMTSGGELMEQEAEVVPGTKKEKKEKKKKFVRTAAGTTWEDPTLADWDTDDFRMFCGDLGNEVTDEHLIRAFSKYPTFQKAKVVRDRRSNKTKGYGFVSFKDPNDFSRAMREMNGKYVGNRPIKLRKSSWKDRQIDIVRKKDKEKKRLGLR